MTTTGVSEVLEAVKSNIASSTGLGVAIGAPQSSSGRLFIFPYRVSEDVHARPTAGVPTAMDPAGGTPERRRLIDFLLLPADASDLADLDLGLACLHDTPVIVLDQSRVSIVPTELSTENLAAVFSSAGVTLRLAGSFRLEWVA